MKIVFDELAEKYYDKAFEIKVTEKDITSHSRSYQKRYYYIGLGDRLSKTELFYSGLKAKLNWAWQIIRSSRKDEFNRSTLMDTDIISSLSSRWRERYHNYLARRRQRLHKAEIERRDRENLNAKPDSGGSKVAFKLTGKTSDETLEEDIPSIHSSSQINFEGPLTSDMRINAGLIVSSDDLEKERAALNENPKGFFQRIRKSAQNRLKNQGIGRR